MLKIAVSEDLHSLQTFRVELDSLWDNVKRTYLECRDRVPTEGETPICKNKLQKQKEEQLTRDAEIKKRYSLDDDMTPTLRLPPCEANVFKGGYREWPTFRDLFSAIYINNPKLSKVEKLFHLTQKTAGEAREVISNVPLTNEGFDIAWKNLVNRYENKRMQVNEQLKTLFNLPTVSIDIAPSVQKLQRTVTSCTQTLEALHVKTGEWDPILVYIVSTKLLITFLQEFESNLEDLRVNHLCYNCLFADHGVRECKSRYSCGEYVKSKYPLGAKIIRENLYVDDVLAGAHTREDAIVSRNELITAVTSAGFELRKWTSNDPFLLKDLDPDILLPINWLDLSEDSSTKTLGIHWNVKGDNFTFKAPIVTENELCTKRDVLSRIAQFFDLCVWLAPVIVVAKLVMQQIWLDQIGWDDPLKPMTRMNWKSFVKNAPCIDTISIPRWIQFSPSSKVEIHGFCYASESAYAAALYIRIEHKDKIYTSLLAAKTRLAPIKKISLPRLELCGAVMFAKLNNRPYLAQKPPCSWSTFVGNRVSDILEYVDNENWNHVDSESNPADVASRGCTPNELQKHELWWTGPQWLKLSKDRWPHKEVNNDTTLEAKPVKVLTTVVAYALRFWRNTGANRTQYRISSLEITSNEIQDIKTRLIVCTQKNYFRGEYMALSQKKRISSNSNLLPLNPFIDSKGIIRSNRLDQLPALSYNERHPILLPHESHFSHLYVEFVHKVTLHGGNQLMTRVIRAEFWIFRLKPLVKKIIHNCRPCIVHRHQTQNQIMASLPLERTTLTRTFAHTGVDFTGPCSIKNFTGRACLITKARQCLIIIAIHLEATSDMSTQSFMAALARFIGRRGCPSKIFSDNGTNFVGAAELVNKDRLEFMKSLKDRVTGNFHQNLEWSFIPPGAMGGWC
ncbi:uncharacterized protein LOC142224851 [Haematobia irritans]|uniref:uncharacterized protein LOC142224851 n=1 Tax=Haematobia irritans TaxID=7368 RepID=UPI003F4F6A05